MKKFLGHKIGDTLVEVTLAIGIFSMVAIAVVSVVSASTSDAQSALETTVTREAIDAQAEALRFLQSTYVSGGETGNVENIYSKIWEHITNKLAQTPDKVNVSYSLDDLKNSDGKVTCDVLYANDNEYLKRNNAFIIDVNNLASKDINSTVKVPNNVTGKGGNISFAPAATYPRLVYNNAGDDTLLNQDGTRVAHALSRVEGIFVIPVKDAKTIVIDKAGNPVNTPAYYDFYIRSCWYGPGADIPSTISTVIRLYDPKLMPNH